MTGNRLAQLIARAMMALGLGVGALAVCLWMFDIRVEIPAWMWRIAVVKLTLAGGLGLLGVGAMLLRHLRRAELLHASDSLAGLPDEREPPQLDAARWRAAEKQRDNAPIKKTDSSRRTP